jgi:lipopolysaccharide/colanic/teichoic acid biosynthesis glycosyltransferase
LVRPGITGWAQVNHTYDQCLDDVRRKVEFDLEYIARQSVAEDVRIMALTVPVMLFRKGAW